MTFIIFKELTVGTNSSRSTDRNPLSIGPLDMRPFPVSNKQRERKGLVRKQIQISHLCK